MLPLNPILKDAFEKFEQDFLAFNLPEGKYIKPPSSTATYYKVGQPCFEDKLQDLYTMGNTGLLRREAEMTLLQPHLGDLRRQELRNSPCWPTPLFKSQLVKIGVDFLLQKGTPKDSQGFGPYQNKPFPHKTVTNHFPQVGGNQTQEAPGVIFDPTQGNEGMETPPPNDSFQASLSSPVGGRLPSFRKYWLTNKCSNNVLNIITNGYVIPFISKPNLVRAPLIRSGY